jgi:hypothetical protein
VPITASGPTPMTADRLISFTGLLLSVALVASVVFALV